MINLSFKNFLFINGTTMLYATLIYTLMYVNHDIYMIQSNSICVKPDIFNNPQCCVPTTTLLEKCYIKTANVVLVLVNNYFATFRYCWKIILIEFSKMILTYVDLLKYMIKDFLVYPTCLICCATSIVLLFIVKMIIYDIFNIKINCKK